MTRSKEVAKFFSCFETFHALVHGYLSGGGHGSKCVGDSGSRPLNPHGRVRQRRHCGRIAAIGLARRQAS